MIATLPQKNDKVVSETRTNVLPSDREIARRVDAIRSKWSVKEKVERRYEAMRRFDDLLESLNDDVAAPAA